jgi:cobalamin biosynthesis Mg chelatase CobN
MLEAAGRGMWDADAATLAQLKELYQVRPCTHCTPRHPPDVDPPFLN